MFSINITDKYAVLFDLINIFGDLQQKGFSNEQMLKICDIFFTEKFANNLDFCVKVNKKELTTAKQKKANLNFEINENFIKQIFAIKNQVEAIRKLK